MKKLYTLLSFALLSVNTNAQSVGIRNLEEDTNITYDFPANNASLDTYFTKRGILIPQYDLIELDNPKYPVDFTNDLANNKIVDGTMIFNYGANQTRGFYIWVHDRWYLALYNGVEPQQLIIRLPGQDSSTPTTILESTTKRIISGWTTMKNQIDGATVNNNSITLPAGKYSYKYLTDTVSPNNNTGQGSNHYFGGYDIQSISTFLQDEKGNTITDTQYSSLLTSSSQGNFAMFQGLFIFELTKPTTIQQTFQHGNGTTYNGAPITVRADFNVIITRLP